jgi:hypothetical protein
VDTYSVDLYYDSTYVFDVHSSSAVDPTLTILDSDNNVVAFDDDSGPGLDAHIEFTPDYDDNYTLSVADYGNNNIGSYTLSTDYDYLS